MIIYHCWRGRVALAAAAAAAATKAREREWGPCCALGPLGVVAAVGTPGAGIGPQNNHSSRSSWAPLISLAAETLSPKQVCLALRCHSTVAAAALHRRLTGGSYWPALRPHVAFNLSEPQATNVYIYILDFQQTEPPHSSPPSGSIWPATFGASAKGQNDI